MLKLPMLVEMFEKDMRIPFVSKYPPISAIAIRPLKEEKLSAADHYGVQEKT